MLRNNLVKGALAGVGLAASVAAIFMMPHEGEKHYAYKDSIGVWTICRGHTKDVKAGDVATQKQCDAWYVEDVKHAEAVYNKLVKVNHHHNVKAAAISFIFNLGEGNFRKSTLLKKLNAGDAVGACKQFPRWHYAGGRDCRVRSNNCYGLVERRQKEMELCLDTNNYFNNPLNAFNLPSGVRFTLIEAHEG
jgi:lysozyme